MDLDPSPIILKAFENLTPNLNDISSKAINYTLTEWREEQRNLVIGSGALAGGIPIFHLAAISADVGFLMNRMSVSNYGIGAIKLRNYPDLCPLEKEDFGMALSMWAGGISLPTPGSSEYSHLIQHIKIEGKAASKFVAKIAAKKLGIFVAKKLAPKVGAKIAAKIGAKIIAKAGSGFFPIFGAGVGAGINWFLIRTICDASENFYNYKISLALDAQK